MVLDIQSKEVIDKVSDELKVQPATEIPRELDKNIKLVYEVNPTRVCNIVRGVQSASVAAQTIFTTPTDRDFFLVAANLAGRNTAGGVDAVMSITVVIDGVAQTLLNQSLIAEITFLATGNSYPFPIKVDRGTAILTAQTNNTQVVVSASIAGYTTDPQ